MSKILLVEDDPSLGNTLKACLEKEGHWVHLANNKSSACSFIRQQIPVDLALLDVGLPDGNGFEVAAEIKAIKTNSSDNVPIIFLSAMNSAEYRLKGFEIGADDYIPKPFHLRELLLRVSRIMPISNDAKQIDINGVKINLLKGCITCSSDKTNFLSKRDLKILTVLINNAPAIVTRAEIVNALTELNSAPSTRSIDNSVVRLRQLLAETKTECIRSVRGLGYQWVVKQ